MPTPVTITGLVDGTAFYPGGTGVWRGVEPRAPLPQMFPESPVMLVGHNWFNVAGFRAAKASGANLKELFWTVLLAILKHIRISEEHCFFTNALMGLIPDTKTAVGTQEGGGPEFRAQCREFFDEQVRIVRPRFVVVMGLHAQGELSDFDTVPKVEIPHPSSHRHSLTKYPDLLAKKITPLTAFLTMHPEMLQWWGHCHERVPII